MFTLTHKRIVRKIQIKTFAFKDYNTNKNVTDLNTPRIV